MWCVCACACVYKCDVCGVCFVYVWDHVMCMCCVCLVVRSVLHTL